MRFSTEPARLIGGRLCLDFANTADWQDASVVVDGFEDCADLFAWGRQVGLIDALPPGPIDSAACLDSVRRLRAAVRASFAACARGQRPSDESIKLVNRWLIRGGVSIGVPADRGPLRYQPPDGDPIAWVALPVALSAAELLTSPDLRRVKLCPGERCGWLFLDESRNGRRHWCSMATCGNRAKARAHYRRHRHAAPR